MFNKLVVSTNERRQNRIVKFFCGTSLIYATVIAGVLALSVVVSSPRLADTSERMLALIGPPPPPAAPAPRQRDNTPPPVTPRNDPNHVTNLDDVVRAPVQPRPAPPTFSNDFNGDTVPGGIEPGPGTGVPGVPGSHGQDEIAAPPPRVVEPTRPPAPQVDTTRPVRLTSTVLQGKAIERRTPAYPALARQIHLSGSVSVEVMISLDGRVESARAVSGHPLLVAAAIEAARGWRFEPTLLNGTPVRVTGVIVFNFTMQ
ncbi:MAG: TonB family protein [Blastocatellia bacterium]